MKNINNLFNRLIASNVLAIAICLFVMGLAVGCQPENTPEVKKPAWTVSASDVDKSRTMTLVFAPAETLSPTSEDLACVMCGKSVISVSKPMNTSVGWRVYLLIPAPADEQETLTIHYYSAAEKRILDAKTVLHFAADERLGSSDEPYHVEF